MKNIVYLLIVIISWERKRLITTKCTLFTKVNLEMISPIRYIVEEWASGRTVSLHDMDLGSIPNGRPKK